jgi:ABC-type branched-subunit amino acid transport system substrate-binding protein
MESNHILIVVEESDSSIGFYDPNKGEIGRIKTGFWPHEIAVSDDGKTAYVTNFGIKDYDENIGVPGASISVIDIQNICEVKRLFTYKDLAEYKKYKAPHGVKISPDGNNLYVNVEGEDEEVLVYNLKDSTSLPIQFFKIAPEFNINEIKEDFISNFDIEEGTHNFLFSEDGKFLFLSAGRKGLFKIDSSNGAVINHIQLDVKDPNPVRGLTYTIDKKSLIVSGRNKIAIVNPADLSIEKSFSNFGVTQLLYSQPSPDGKYILAPAVWESTILVIDINSGSIVERIQVGIDPIHLAFDKESNKAYVSHGRSKYISVVDLITFEVERKIETKGGPNGIAVVPFFETPAKRIIKIGACLPLTVSVPTVGNPYREGREILLGYQFWQERTNDAGGILIDGKAYKVELIIRDTFSKSLGLGDKEFIQSLTRELVEIEKVDFLLGSYPTPPNLYIAEIAHESKTPFITATGAGEIIYNQGFDFVYGIMSPARVYLKGTIDTLIDEHPNEKPKTILFLSCNDPAAKEDAEKTALHAKQKGLIPVDIETTYDTTKYSRVQAGVYTYSHNNIDFSDIITLVKKAAPDLFFNTGHLSESDPILTEIINQNFSPKGIAFSVGPTLLDWRNKFLSKDIFIKDIFGSAQWNEYVNIVGFDEIETPQNFAKYFFERFSMHSSYFSAGGYACGVVLKEALIKAKSLNKETVNNELKKTNIKTFFAGIQFDKRGLNDNKPIITIQLQQDINGNLLEIPLSPKELAYGKSNFPFKGWRKIITTK